jgi:hypothetical protein
MYVRPCDCRLVRINSAGDFLVVEADRQPPVLMPCRLRSVRFLLRHFGTTRLANPIAIDQTNLRLIKYCVDSAFVRSTSKR